MNAGIVFYSARKTSLCERTLARCTATADVSISGAVFATSARSLGEKLAAAFEENDAVFLIGGLDFGDSRGAVEIISAALPETQLFVRKLKNPEGEDGYVIRSGKQMLVMLPDEPEQIEAALSGDASAYIAYCSRYGQE